MGSAGDTTTHSPNQSAFFSVLLSRSSRFLTTHRSQLVPRGELNSAWCLQRWEQPQEDGLDTLTVSLGLGVRARVSQHLLILYLLCVRHRIRSFAHIISFKPLIILSSGTVLNPFYTGK